MPTRLHAYMYAYIFRNAADGKHQAEHDLFKVAWEHAVRPSRIQKPLRGKGRQGKAREGKGGEGRAREGKGRPGRAREGKGRAREGKARPGKGQSAKPPACARAMAAGVGLRVARSSTLGLHKHIMIQYKYYNRV